MYKVNGNHYSHGQVFGTRVPHLWVLAVEPIKYLLEELKREIISVTYKLNCILTNYYIASLSQQEKRFTDNSQ